jgi:hypothetical protein
MIAENLRLVREKIDNARLRRLNADKNEAVTLIAVTKNHPAEAAQAAIAAGALDLGENRVQEAKEKFPQLSGEFTRHLIGHLQTNKAKAAVAFFDLIHSIDSLRLATAVDEAAAKINKVQDVLVQVNLAREASKGGIYFDELPYLVTKIRKDLPHLRLRGFMMMAPAYEDTELCRPLFQEMYDIFLQAKEIDETKENIKYLSMGMSHDYEIAVEEGANMVRVGTAIFGERDYGRH